MSSPAQVERPITAEEAVAAIQEYAALRTHRDRVYGIRYDAASGRNRLCLFHKGEAIPLLSDAFSVRSRVHEYGGGGWCLSNGDAFFVNDSDQQIWCVSLQGGDARQLTDIPGSRFADLIFDTHRQRLISICETHEPGGAEPVNRLVSIGCDGKVGVLAEGADFYSSPALSPDDSELAWVEWNHPHQPWVNTRLCLAGVATSGLLKDRREISDTEGAWAQPRFSPEGQLHAVVDRDNWWHIERYNGERFESLPGAIPSETEFTTAPWQFGIATYGWCEQGRIHAIGQQRGYSALFRHDGKGWQQLQLDTPATRLHSLTVADGNLCCIAEYSDRLPAVLSLQGDGLQGDVRQGEASFARIQCETLHGGTLPDYPVTEPEPCFVPFDAGSSLPYFLYRPAGAGDVRLPLVIYIHGGPTAATAPIFRPGIQFWTQRGFMIADVNYRGSTGYGRDYRMKLAGQWGVADVEDVEAVVCDLIDRQLADPEAIFIRGNSAGGYTTLNALAHSRLFAAGASLYGVSDPARLNEITHKFESRYLHWLIGDPSREQERYRKRSPLHNAHRIKSPVIFFQGERDRVVLPEQTRQMVERLKTNAVPVEAHYFEDEAHGFRQAENQAWVLEQELAFYRRRLKR